MANHVVNHGSRYHRRPGSMGGASLHHVSSRGKACQVKPVANVTIQNLEVVAVDVESCVILIQGVMSQVLEILVEIKQA